MVKINANLKNKKTGDIIIPNTTTANVADVAKNQALSATLVNTPDKSTLGYPSFSTLVSYSIEQIVYYDNKLYKFKAAHSAGAWNADHVDEVSIKEDLTNYSDTKISKVSNPTVNNIPIINNNGELTDSNVGIDKVAHIDGFYEGMGVGVAKRLEGNTDVAGSFLERTTGGDAELANGLAQLNEVQGNSVKFNQLMPDHTDISSNSTCIYSDGVYTTPVTAQETTATTDTMYSIIPNEQEVYPRSYLFVRMFIKSSDPLIDNVRIIISSSTNTSSSIWGYRVAKDVNEITQEFKEVKFIIRSYNAETLRPPLAKLGVQYPDTAPVDFTYSIKEEITVVNLTKLFGAGNEPSTVAEFEAWLAENVGLQEYYGYNPGSVINNNMTSLESTGFNLFNPTTGKARIIGAYSDVYGNYYGITGTYGTLTFEDDLGNVSTVTPDSDGKFELDVPGYINVADAGNDVAVFLWWDGKKTEYEDYDVDVSHLDVRHIYGKKNGTGELVQVWPTGMPRINDVVDKLCIENGAVMAKRNLGEADMGNLNWTSYLRSDETCSMRTYSLGSKLSVGVAGVVDLLTSKYTAVPRKNNAGSLNVNNKEITHSNTSDLYVFVYDTDYNASDSASAFKKSVKGQILYYRLATPENYTDLVYMGSEYFADGTPVALPVNYKVDNWGVETILPMNTSTILTAKPTIKVRYAIDAVEQLNTHSDEIEDLYESLDELDGAKANTVGIYDDMVVGAAKAIAGNQRLDKEFTSMVVEGADGVAKINEVRGKSLVWNQLISNGDVTRTHTGPSEYYAAFTQDIASVTRIENHYYYLAFNIDRSISTNDAVSINYGGSTTSNSGGLNILVADGSPNGRYSSIKQANSSGDFTRFCVNNSSGKRGFEEGDYVTIENIICIDLTSMFGAGNEPATVEEFEAMFPDAYYEYNAGEIINNATEKLDVTGFNQWDGTYSITNYYLKNDGGVASSGNYDITDYIDVFAGQTYYLGPISGSTPSICWYDGNKIFISGTKYLSETSKLVTAPANARYCMFSVPKVNPNVCLNLSLSGYRNGEYEPYKHGVVSLNLSTITGKQVGVEDAESVTIFPDGMRQAGSVADTLLVDDDGYARRALVKVGSRAYQSGDESDSTVVTDLTNTLYALETNSEYILDEPILMTFKAYHGGTIVQSPQAPDSAPMSMNVTFALDAVGTLNNLPKNYISADSMDAFLAQLGTAMNGTWTKSWDSANNRYGFTFTPNA